MNDERRWYCLLTIVILSINQERMISMENDMLHECTMLVILLRAKSIDWTRMFSSSNEMLLIT